MNAIVKIDDDDIVPVYDVPPLSRLVIEGEEYVHEGRLPEGHRLGRPGDLLFSETLTHEHLHHLVEGGLVRIEGGFFTSARAEMRLAAGPKTFSDLTERQARKVLFKEEWCKDFLKWEATNRRGSRSKEKLEVAIETISKRRIGEAKAALRRRAAEEGRRTKRGAGVETERFADPSPAQLGRWVVKYERKGYLREALIDRYHGPGRKGSSLCSASHALHMKQVLAYAGSERPTKRTLFDRLQGELDEADAKRKAEGKAPLRRFKRRAFEKLIRALDPFFVSLGRDGPEAAMRRWGIVSTGLDVEKPFERVEIDSWRVSLMTILVDAGIWDMLDKKQRDAIERARIWLTVAIDARTRVILAMRFLDGAPNAESTLATLELAMADKSAMTRHAGTTPRYPRAKPRRIALDNGSENANKEVVLCTALLGIDTIFPIAGLAQMRARVERIFGTLKTLLLTYFSGQTFSNIVEKGDYDAEGNAGVLVEELNEIFLVGAVDLYHNLPHEGLNGETPWDCLRRLSRDYGIPVPPHRDVVRHVLGVQCWRRIGPEGIRFLGVRFQSRVLQQLRRTVGQKAVEVRVARDDMSRISVRTETGGWITCHARYRGLEGVSIWRWTEAVRQLRERNAAVAAESRSVVMSAVRRLSDMGEMAVKRAELGARTVSSEMLAKFEKQLFKSLEFADDGDWGDDLALPEAPTAGNERDRDDAPPAPPKSAEDHVDDQFGAAVDWRND